MKQLEEEYATFRHVNPRTLTIAENDIIDFFEEPRLKPIQISLL